MNSNTNELQEYTDLDLCSILIAQGSDERYNEAIMVLCGNHDDIKNNLKEYLEKYEVSYKYTIMPMIEYDENDINYKYKNIILTSNDGIDFNIIRDSNKTFYTLDLTSDWLGDLKDTLSTIIQKTKKYDKNHEEFLYLLEFLKRKPIDIVFSDTAEIDVCLSLVTNNINKKDFVKKDTISIFKKLSNEEILQWQLDIQKDIYYLEKYGDLTFNLAKAIYQISTNNDYTSDEKIYLYYHKFIGSPNYCDDYKSYIWNINDKEDCYA